MIKTFVLLALLSFLSSAVETDSSVGSSLGSSEGSSGSVASKGHENKFLDSNEEEEETDLMNMKMKTKYHMNLQISRFFAKNCMQISKKFKLKD